jgi:integrase
MTSDPRQAKQRAAALFLATERLFALASNTRITDEDIQAAARRWLSSPSWTRILTNRVDDLLPGNLRFEHEALPDRLLELDAEDPEHRMSKKCARRFEALAALESAGYQDCDLTVIDSTAESMLAMLRDYVDRRMREVFRPDQIVVPSPGLVTSVSPEVALAGPSPRLLEHVNPWQQALVTGWKNVDGISEHSAKQYGVAVRLFSEIVGDRRVGDITYDDAETFRDQILKLPTSLGKGRHVHALEAIKHADAKGSQRMSMKTAKRHNTAMNRYWEWLVFKGLIPRTPSPFSDHKFPGTKSSSRDRDAWSTEQLERIFRSADYLSHPRDSAEHWLPLISLHSGMRLEEICRLRPGEDIQSINGVASFVIQKHPDGWDPKTEAGERKIPVHPWLIEHGLLALVQRRRIEGAGRIFPDLPLQGWKLGAKFSRDFSRFKISMGFGPKLVFHSFRHTFRTELESTSHKDSHINAVMGHEGGPRGEGRTYVKSVAPKVLAMVVKSFRSPLVLDFLHTAERSAWRREPFGHVGAHPGGERHRQRFRYRGLDIGEPHRCGPSTSRASRLATRPSSPNAVGWRADARRYCPSRHRGTGPPASGRANQQSRRRRSCCDSWPDAGLVRRCRCRQP